MDWSAFFTKLLPGQTSFSSALATVAQNYPQIQVAQASDSGFLIGTNADEVVEAVCNVFAYASVYFNPTQSPLIPMRAALATGLVRVATDKQALQELNNFYCLPYWGAALAKVYLMEKLGPKGMRVFVTDSVKSRLGTNSLKWVQTEVGKVGIHGQGKEAYHELNWLLHAPIGGANLMEKFIDHAVVLAQKGSVKQIIVGSSVLELTGHEHYHKFLYKTPITEKIKRLVFGRFCGAD